MYLQLSQERKKSQKRKKDKRKQKNKTKKFIYKELGHDPWYMETTTLKYEAS